MLFVKICGITRLEDALLAAELGADAIGFVFFEKSPRYISLETARHISDNLPSHVARVGVFVNPDPTQVEQACSVANLNALQLHGVLSPSHVNKFAFMPLILALPVKHPSIHKELTPYQSSITAALLDAYHPHLHGGSGKIFNWHYAVDAARQTRVIVAGGLRPDNVRTAVELVQPYGVDVSSGVEKLPGIKDSQKLTRLFKNLEEHRCDWNAERHQLFPLA